MMLRICALVLSIGVLFGMQPRTAHAEDIDVVVTLPALTLSYAASWIAEDAGIYKKNGLKVETRQLVGVAANNAVINGSADFLLGTAATYLNGVAKGQRLLILANMVDRPSSELILRKDVAEAAGITAQSTLEQRLKALKGKTIAVGGIGSAPHAWLRLVARKAGLDPETDFVTAPIDAPAQIAAMQAKRVDGVSAPPPFSTEGVIKYGAVMLASPAQGDLSEYFPTAATVVIARPENCQKNPEKCLRMAHSMQDAVRMIKEQPAEVWEIIKKRNAQMDPAVLEGAWAVSSKIYTDDMRVTDKMLDVAQKFSVDAGLIQPEDVVKDYKGLYTDQYLKK